MVSQNGMAKNMCGTCSGTSNIIKETSDCSEEKKHGIGGLQSVPHLSHSCDIHATTKSCEKWLKVIYCSFKCKHQFKCKIRDDSVESRAHIIATFIDVSFLSNCYL